MKLLTILLATFVAAAPLAAQQPDATAAVQATDSVRAGISPRSAFIRSLIIPGWGQASAGAYKRGGIFFAIQSGSWYMLLKTLSRLADAHDIEDRRVAFVSDTLRARMAMDTALARQLADPRAFSLRVDSAATVRDIRALINSREEQRQDWITYTLFFTLASGVDAFVAAHLSDFPTTISTRPAPTGGMQLKFSVPLQRP